MKEIRWASLIVAVSDGFADRVAVFDERFPAALAALGNPEWFTVDLAMSVLHSFAGAWPTLGRAPVDPPSERSMVGVVPGVGAVRFVGRNLAHPNNREARVVVFALILARAAGSEQGENR